MNNSSIWNLFNPLRSGGGLKLLSSGQEMFGTVIKQGISKKSIKVRVHYRYWNHMYRVNFGRFSNYLVHDEENFCRIGDKVVIKSSGTPISKQKHFYVRNVVKQFPRNDYYLLNAKQAPTNTMETNQNLYQNFVDQEKIQLDFLEQKKEASKAKKDAQTQAMNKAMENMRKTSLEPKEKRKEIKTRQEKQAKVQARQDRSLKKKKTENETKRRKNK